LQVDLDQVPRGEVGLEQAAGGDEDAVGRQTDRDVAIGAGDEPRLPEAAAAADYLSSDVAPADPSDVAHERA
jgi:hypothetical protein